MPEVIVMEEFIHAYNYILYAKVLFNIEITVQHRWHLERCADK